MDLKIYRMILRILTCLLLFTTITIPAFIGQVQAGELYQWKDKDGNIYLSDTPPDSSVHQGEVKSTYAPEEPETEMVTKTEKKPTDKKPPLARQKDVTIYTNST